MSYTGFIRIKVVINKNILNGVILWISMNFLRNFGYPNGGKVFLMIIF